MLTSKVPGISYVALSSTLETEIMLEPSMPYLLAKTETSLVSIRPDATQVERKLLAMAK